MVEINCQCFCKLCVNCPIHTVLYPCHSLFFTGHSFFPLCLIFPQGRGERELSKFLWEAREGIMCQDCLSGCDHTWEEGRWVGTAASFPCLFSRIVSQRPAFLKVWLTEMLMAILFSVGHWGLMYWMSTLGMQVAFSVLSLPSLEEHHPCAHVYACICSHITHAHVSSPECSPFSGSPQP